MRIWYDACTGKQIRYGTAITQRFRELGHEVIFTTRDHPDTLALAEMLGEKPLVIGKYNPDSLFSRLEESTKRILHFSTRFKTERPDVAVSHQSVELTRTAFGLGIPIISTADTPHAKAVNKLTIPFADVLVVSKAIPNSFFRRYGRINLVQFEGVDEVAWIKNLPPSKNSTLSHPLIVIRQMETKAAYLTGKPDLTASLAKKLSALGNVLFLPRYKEAGSTKSVGRKGIVDSVSLVSNADLFVGTGGTLTREAALQGTPSITVTEMGRTYVNRYLAKMGFPIFHASPSRILSYAKKYLGRKFDVEEKLAQLENPIDKIWDVIQNKKYII